MAENYSFVIDQGADWYLNLQYKDSAGAPINLTGYAAAATAARSASLEGDIAC